MAEFTTVKRKTKDDVTFTIRHCVESDAPKLLKCATRYVADGDGQVMEVDEFNISEPQEREWIRGMRLHPREILLIAEFDHEIIGNVDFHINRRSRLAHVGTFGMGLLPEWRSRGVGSALLKELIKWAKKNPKIEKIDLQVISTNKRAIGLYKKMGLKKRA